MSWFSKPVEYRRYHDGTVEIIERRSFLRIGAAVLVGLGLVSAGAYTLWTPPVIGPDPDKDRSPFVTQQKMVQIIRDQDIDAIYKILPHYGQLTDPERFCFWTAVEGLKLDELKPFAGFVINTEHGQQSRPAVEQFIRKAEERGR